jgi:hypothetical protein
VGKFASDVGDRLRDSLAAAFPGREWRTEHYVGGTPVDVASPGNPVVFVEVECRRADPANNPVKLARHVDEGVFDAPVVLVQVFSEHYVLDSGGPNSKRENAEFVGEVAAETLDSFSYHALDLAVDPPKRGGERPELA